MQRSVRSSLSTRILLLDASVSEGEFAKQQLALMNCAFAAQRTGVLFDCCSLRARSSTSLRQAVDVTGGVHRTLEARPGQQLAPSTLLLPTLLVHFLADASTRKLLATRYTPTSQACVCVCHNQPQELAFLCSCCLAPYCSDAVAICKMCRTRLKPERKLVSRMTDEVTHL
eukprot:gnl/MRDRNA2_/MRDRNA2_54969_c0_seq1.p1 gnl/MRDRNA2_/MRDRNA2_54969_c0~~gnl/MRDRNA2_/MRDRNA2_54969_c0_seq1.p1  ORF type:complete len:171 (+),score=16.13 gnl/MRDRNA2_/MRDRNA2_54969_c0_seq1:2-514(+)